MPRMQLDYNSQVLKKEVHLQILHPTPGKFEGPHPVLYLLHGLMVDETAWLRYTMLEQYAKDKNLIIVMPDGGRSYYINQKNGPNYNRLITKELPQIIGSIFHVSDKKKDTFIAGMSMGGYGAMLAGLGNPDQYGKVMSISGVLDIESIYDNKSKRLRTFEIENMFGENTPKDTANDLYKLSNDLIDSDKQSPDLYLLCGNEDSLIGQNKEYVDTFKDRLPIKQSFESGGHDFDYWNKAIKKVINELTA